MIKIVTEMIRPDRSIPFWQDTGSVPPEVRAHIKEKYVDTGYRLRYNVERSHADYKITITQVWADRKYMLMYICDPIVVNGATRPLGLYNEEHGIRVEQDILELDL